VEGGTRQSGEGVKDASERHHSTSLPPQSTRRSSRIGSGNGSPRNCSPHEKFVQYSGRADSRCDAANPSDRRRGGEPAGSSNGRLRRERNSTSIEA